MAYYPSSRAEGIASGSDGSILEEYLDKILVLPVEVRRYVTLMRELDKRCAKEKDQLEKMQEDFTEKVKAKFAALKQNKKSDNVEEREKCLAAMKESPEFKKIESLRKTLKQKVLEKISISDQLYDISSQNKKRIDSDVEKFQQILRASGDLVEDKKISKGSLVAASVPQQDGGSMWILCKVVEYSNSGTQTNQKIIVADAEDASQTHTLRITQIVPLSEHEDVAAAKNRLPSRGRMVMAMYPDTTSFYKSTLVTLPYKASSGVVCAIQFYDDEDSSGIIPRRIIPTKYVFRL
mmetsp:Transcript_12308/g.14135  ORF Transcript_12308/g.14135 Transcript_12308/m.14135 type:complete len:293 (+) Transcript_12308:226-1104(+)